MRMFEAPFGAGWSSARNRALVLPASEETREQQRAALRELYSPASVREAG
jgi:hypothetical protein